MSGMAVLMRHQSKRPRESGNGIVSGVIFFAARIAAGDGAGPREGARWPSGVGQVIGRDGLRGSDAT